VRIASAKPELRIMSTVSPVRPAFAAWPGTVSAAAQTDLSLLSSKAPGGS
jgi:hypothetical protein